MVKAGKRQPARRHCRVGSSENCHRWTNSSSARHRHCRVGSSEMADRRAICTESVMATCGRSPDQTRTQAVVAVLECVTGGMQIRKSTASAQGRTVTTCRQLRNGRPVVAPGCCRCGQLRKCTARAPCGPRPSLPCRQLRNWAQALQRRQVASLPCRQLRKRPSWCSTAAPTSLPCRQLRKSSMRACTTAARHCREAAQKNASAQIRSRLLVTAV